MSETTPAADGGEAQKWEYFVTPLLLHNEAASLIAIVQYPSSLNLFDAENIPANQERRDYVLEKMLEKQRITQAQYDEAVATPVTPNLTVRQSGCSVAEANYGLGHFCDLVQRTIEQDPSFGNTDEERHFEFLRGGFEIMTTIDLDMQAAAVSAMRDNVPATLDFMEIGSAVSSVQVGTGRILTMAQNRPFSADPEFIASNPGYTAINYNTDEVYGGSNGFQVGSTMKAFTLAEWLNSGHSLYDSVNGNGRTVNDSSFRAECLGGVYGGGSWSFKNDANESPGNTSVMTGTAQSINGVFVSMQQKMDLCDTIKLAESLGVHRASKQTIEGFPNYGTTNLTINPAAAFAGTDEIAPLTMAVAYAAFPNKGITCTPVPIDSITDAEGNEVGFTKSQCTEGVSPDVAAGVLYALQGVVQNGTMTHGRSEIGVPHFGKSGTTDDAVDRWNLGGSSTVATAVWIGNVTSVLRGDEWVRISLNNSGLGRAERPIFASVMNAADLKYGGEAFPDPPRTATERVMVRVPSVVGLSFAEASQVLTAAGFGVVKGDDVGSATAAGLVASMNPSGEASRGADIVLRLSRGNLKTVPDGLIGASGGEAQAILVNAGFSKVSLSCSSGSAPAGQLQNNPVESVTPAQGAEANPANQVTLKVECT